MLFSRRATDIHHISLRVSVIAIHALLAESDGKTPVYIFCARGISIHALLVESDFGGASIISPPIHFYPRSPRGERPFAEANVERTVNFYPRSPRGERQQNATKNRFFFRKNLLYYHYHTRFLEICQSPFNVLYISKGTSLVRRLLGFDVLFILALE